MRTKRTLTFLMTFILAGGMWTGCAKVSASEKEKSLYEHGMDMVALLDEMVRSDAYGEMMGNPDGFGDVVERIREGNYTEPAAVYQMEISAGILDEAILDISPDDSDFSDVLWESLRHKWIGNLVFQINAYSGVSYVAASSVYTADKVFTGSELSEDTVYIYTFEEGFPIMVSFIAGEGKVVEASGSFVLYEETEGEDEKDIRELLEEQFPYLAACEINELE